VRSSAGSPVPACVRGSSMCAQGRAGRGERQRPAPADAPACTCAPRRLDHVRLASVVASSVTLAVRVEVSSRRKVEGRQTLRGEASIRFSTCASAVTGAGAGRGAHRWVKSGWKVEVCSGANLPARPGRCTSVRIVHCLWRGSRS
jgi:hypothetical protein